MSTETGKKSIEQILKEVDQLLLNLSCLEDRDIRIQIRIAREDLRELKAIIA